MLILVDLRCPSCEHEIIDSLVNNREELPDCPECGTQMAKLPSPLRFELKYDNRKDSCDWDGNSSQYWNDIKEKGGDEPPNDRQDKWS